MSLFDTTWQVFLSLGMAEAACPCSVCATVRQHADKGRGEFMADNLMPDSALSANEPQEHREHFSVDETCLTPTPQPLLPNSSTVLSVRVHFVFASFLPGWRQGAS